MQLLLPEPIFYFSLFLIIATLVPLVRQDFWIFRVFEYPRLQKFVINVMLLLVILIWYFPEGWITQLLTAALVLNICYLMYQIYPFTVLGSKQIVTSRKKVKENSIRLLIANVFQDNRRAGDYLQLIEECNPDIILMVETNLWWQNQMDQISSHYPHQVKIPLENTYGMLLYSRFELENGTVNFLVEEDIPSIETKLKLKSGQMVKIFCLHPQPPVPQENPRSTERDREILMIGKKAKKCTEPVIVMGDLNDVAWSYTTELFCKISGLLDPRKGRGFFNSFNAKYFFLRFPLDHIFCSADFSLSKIQRMKSCGSDHFPMLVELQYDPVAELVNDVPEADHDDQKLAQEKINKPLA